MMHGMGVHEESGGGRWGASGSRAGLVSRRASARGRFNITWSSLQTNVHRRMFPVRSLAPRIRRRQAFIVFRPQTCDVVLLDSASAIAIFPSARLVHGICLYNGRAYSFPPRSPLGCPSATLNSNKFNFELVQPCSFLLAANESKTK